MENILQKIIDVTGAKIKHGPCVDFFDGGHKKCEYGYGFIKYPACCNATSCQCTCVYMCHDKKQIAKNFKMNPKLNDYENTKCTSSISNKEEGHEWRKKNCLADRRIKTG